MCVVHNQILQLKSFCKLSLNVNTDAVNTKAEIANSQLLVAALNGNSLVIQKILQKKVNLNIRNQFGHTLLYLAVRSNNLETVGILLDHEIKNQVDKMDNFRYIGQLQNQQRRSYTY